MVNSQSFGKVLAFIFGVALIAVGLFLLAVFAMDIYVSTVLACHLSGGSSVPVVGNSSVFVIMPSLLANITVSSSNAYFRVAVVVFTRVVNVTSITCPPSVRTWWVNLTEVRGVNFTGNYTRVTVTVWPYYVLLVWPYKASPHASLHYSFRETPFSRPNVTQSMIIMFWVERLTMIAVPLVGGALLIWWSRR